MKQTAVEWFADNILSYKNPTNINGTDYILIPINKVEYLKEKAKEIEKDEIINAYETSHISMMTAEQYYNETFNTEEK
jgi:hypothetical protein